MENRKKYTQNLKDLENTPLSTKNLYYMKQKNLNSGTNMAKKNNVWSDC